MMVRDVQMQNAGIGNIYCILSDDYGTNFAGAGKICDKSLTPNQVRAKRLRSQKYW